MAIIDYTTVALVLAIIYVIIAMVFFVLMRIINWEQGINIWFISSIISIICFIALFLRPAIGAYGQAIATFALLTSTYLIIEGVLRFRHIGNKDKRKYITYLFALVFLIIAVFTTNNARIRYLIMDALVLGMCPIIIYYFLKGTKGAERLLSYLFACAFIFEGAWFSIRWFLALTDALGNGAVTDHPFMGTIFLASIIWLLMYIFSILLVISYRAQARLQETAERDVLTGLYNRRKLDANYKSIINGDKLYKEYFAIYLLDVNDFKTVNDTYGHVFGDILLVELAKRIQMITRTDDFSCRFGGDEFIIILKLAGRETEAIKARDRIKRIIEEPIECCSYTINIKTAIGFMVVDNPEITLDEILMAADKSMYSEKGSHYEITTVIEHDSTKLPGRLDNLASS